MYIVITELFTSFFNWLRVDVNEYKIRRACNARLIWYSLVGKVLEINC